MEDKDLKYMELALELAGKALGRTSPNPMVGAVVVKDGRIVGKGYHARAGTPHAEIHALREAGDDAVGATLYVTLEPCCHHGRTGPCTEAVIRAGIKKVVMGMTDPNPLVAGKGARKLRDSGIEVVCGVREAQARRLNEVFIKYISTGMPYVVLKTAMSLDGKIATAGGESKWITGPRAREHVHLLRDRYDAILVGIGTVLADDPSLTTRLPDREGRDPARVILDSGAATPPGAKILTQNSQAPTIIITTGEAPPDNVKRLESAGAVVIKVPGSDEGIALADMLRELAGREITSVLVEGGARVNGAFVRDKLVDKVYWYIAPKIIGGGKAPGPVGGPGIELLNDALQIENIEVHDLGNDICIEGYVAVRGGLDVYRIS